MSRIGPVSVALWTAISISCAALLLSPSIAQGKCLQWHLDGKWTIVASNGTSVFNLRTSGDDIQGTVETENKEGLLGHVWSGKVYGKLEGNNLQLNVYWETGTTSVFVGTIGSFGRVEGYSYLTDSPENRAIWNTSQTSICIDQEISALCKQYAETAMKQSEENVARHCGFKDNLWVHNVPEDLARKVYESN
jgi:hypothetical protein